jgi:hypothetical protein
MSKIYQASPLKRSRTTKAELLLLDAGIVETVRKHRPCSVRQAFYQMTDPRLPAFVEKSDKGYRKVQERCLKLRRSGRIKYKWIADMSRRAYRTNVFDDAFDFVERMSSLYRADLWRDADVVCEVWVESRSIASSIIDLCDRYAVNLYPCGGFSSVSFVYSAAAELNANNVGKPLVIFFIGDFDPAGVLIDVALERELRTHLDPGIKLDFRRIGINQEMVDEYDLPTKPRKIGDKRSLHVQYTVEAEALPANTLRSLLEAEIVALLPSMALEIARVAEESEKSHLQRMADLLRSPDSDEEDEGGEDEYEEDEE